MNIFKTAYNADRIFVAEKVAELLLKGAIAYIATVALFTTLQYSFFRVMPMSYWVEYQAIQAPVTPLELEEPPVFVSHAIGATEKAVNISWNDVLRCNFDDNGDGFKYLSNYESSVTNYIAKEEVRATSWQYNSTVPHKPAICYLDSTITIKLPFGIEKHQRIITDEFRYE